MLVASTAKDIYKSKKHVITALVIMVLLLLSAGCTESKKTTDTKAPVKFSDTIFFKYGDEGLKNASEQGLINAVSLTTKNGNDSLVVKEVFYDRTRVSVSLVAGTGGLIAKEFDYKFYYNGRLFPTPVNWNRFLKVVQGRQYDIVSLDTFSGLPAKFDLKIVATRFGNSKEVMSTTVPVDRTQSDVLTKEASIMRGFIAKPRSVTIKSILIAPSATVISYVYSGLSNDMLNSPQLVDQNGKKIDYVGKGGSTTVKDKKGVSVEYFDIFGPVSMNPGEFNMNFVFVDENKNEIPIPVKFMVP